MGFDTIEINLVSQVEIPVITRLPYRSTILATCLQICQSAKTLTLYDNSHIAGICTVHPSNLVRLFIAHPALLSRLRYSSKYLITLFAIFHKTWHTQILRGFLCDPTKTTPLSCQLLAEILLFSVLDWCVIQYAFLISHFSTTDGAGFSTLNFKLVSFSWFWFLVNWCSD